MRDDLPSYQDLVREPADSLQAKLAVSPQEAARWVEAAALNGSKPAILNWGQMLLDGHGVARDPEAAFRWFRIAAQAGDVDGVNMVGRCHEHGWGVPQDVEEAGRCYNFAAGLGHHWAMFNLAMLVLEGKGIASDPQRALSLFVRSARMGNAKAMNMLGRYCEEGWHGRVKLHQAVRWYARAAVRGCFRGQFHLARFYAARGDFAEAAGWLQHSFAIAPADFRGEAAELFDRHADPAVRSLAQLARRSGRAAETASLERT
jgi:TPR repeat protein